MNLCLVKPSAVVAAIPLLAVVGFSIGLPTAVRAQSFLVGAVLYSSSSNGTNQSAYAFSTNSATPHFRLSLTLGASTQNNAISFALADGANNFTFVGSPGADPGSFGGLEFFFNSTGTSFNPDGATGVAGDLTAVANTNVANSFFIPLGGTAVRSYDNGPINSVYSGANAFTVGGKTITISALNMGHTPSGTFTLNVGNAAAPEPSALALLALPLAGTVIQRRNRRNRTESSGGAA
jgi:hypothetical protein